MASTGMALGHADVLGERQRVDAHHRRLAVLRDSSRSRHGLAFPGASARRSKRSEMRECPVFPLETWWTRKIERVSLRVKEAPFAPRLIAPARDRVERTRRERRTMAQLKAGTRRLKSAVCTTEVMVIAAPKDDVAVTCGGAPLLAMADAKPDGGAVAADANGGTLLGKRYVNASGDLDCSARRRDRAPWAPTARSWSSERPSRCPRRIERWRTLYRRSLLRARVGSRPRHRVASGSQS
ncbi:MAG: hypothetical protein U0610_04280 [bacterium]